MENVMVLVIQLGPPVLQDGLVADGPWPKSSMGKIWSYSVWAKPCSPTRSLVKANTYLHLSLF